MSTILRSSSTMSTVGKAVPRKGLKGWARLMPSGAPLGISRAHPQYIVRRTREIRVTRARRAPDRWSGARRARASFYLWMVRTSFGVDHLGDAGLYVGLALGGLLLRQPAGGE